MRRIGTDNGLFIGGDPASGTQGTRVTAEWLNAVQEEIAKAMELLGGTLDPAVPDQLGSLLLSRIGGRPGDFIFLPYAPTSAQMAERKILQGNGGSVLDSDFPKIIEAWGGKIFGKVDDSHFNLPPLSGYFPRFWNHGAGVGPDAQARLNRGDGTSGDVVGSRSMDSIRSHAHQILMRVVGDTSNSGRVAKSHSAGQADTIGGQPVQPFGGNQTAPMNIYIWGGVFY